ncbi:MAG: CapA family protein [Treponemataceae bacterium]|nr:MAG: CapA family protein [Treponemataceae bacterium]
MRKYSLKYAAIKKPGKLLFCRFLLCALCGGISALMLFSCVSIKPEALEKIEKGAKIPGVEAKAKKDAILLTFTGDIMAHEVNFRMNDYDEIYADITAITKNDDLTFANFEAPVDESRPYETYPTFNVKNAYADAAIKAGFDVFSTANNHTNDQGKDGIIATTNYFASKKRHKVYFAGTKLEENGPLSFALIDVRGWKVLFVAVTELLNSPRSKGHIDFIAPTQKERAAFVQTVRDLRAQNKCDLFVLSIHTSEEEYVEAVAASRREYYYALLDAGVDILWANHPHIAREWCLVENAKTSRVNKFIIYSNGNTISGQRSKPAYTKPETARDYTGDSYMFLVKAEKSAEKNTGAPTEEGAPITLEVQPVLITTHIDSERRYIIKRLTDEFIASFPKDAQPDLGAYYSERKRLMEKIPQTRISR